MGSPEHPAEVVFTRAGTLAGAARALPLALGVLSYGAVWGVLARGAGMSLAEAALMSGLVYAGASQFIAVGLWDVPPPLLALLGTTLVVNLRLLLMGAALRPWLARLSAWKTYPAVWLMADENWALSIAEWTGRGDAPEGRSERSPVRLIDAAFLVGSGVALWFGWVGGTVLGHVAGAVVRDPAAWGLDFAFTAAFGALLVGLWRGRGDLLPWAVAAAVAVASERLLPGAWYILLGALAGSLVGGMSDEG